LWKAEDSAQDQARFDGAAPEMPVGAWSANNLLKEYPEIRSYPKDEVADCRASAWGFCQPEN